MFSLYNTPIFLLLPHVTEQAVGITTTPPKIRLSASFLFRYFPRYIKQRDCWRCPFVFLPKRTRYNLFVVPYLCQIHAPQSYSFYKYLIKQFRSFLNPPLLFSIVSGRVLRHFMKFMFFRHKQTQTKFFLRSPHQRDLSYFCGGLDYLRGAVFGFTNWYLFQFNSTLDYTLGITNYQRQRKISIVELANSPQHIENLSVDLCDWRLATLPGPAVVPELFYDVADPIFNRYARLANKIISASQQIGQPSINVRPIGGVAEFKTYPFGTVVYGRQRRRKTQSRWGRLFLLTKKTSKVSRKSSFGVSPNLMSLTLRHVVVNRSLMAFSLLPVPYTFFVNLLANNSLIWYNLLSELFTYFRGRR